MNGTEAVRTDTDRAYRDEIQLLFDPLVEEIAQRIDEQLAMLQLKRSNRSVVSPCINNSEKRDRSDD